MSTELAWKKFQSRLDRTVIPNTEDEEFIVVAEVVQACSI